MPTVGSSAAWSGLWMTSTVQTWPYGMLSYGPCDEPQGRGCSQGLRSDARAQHEFGQVVTSTRARRNNEFGPPRRVPTPPRQNRRRPEHHIHPGTAARLHGHRHLILGRQGRGDMSVANMVEPEATGGARKSVQACNPSAPAPPHAPRCPHRRKAKR